MTKTSETLTPRNPLRVSTIAHHLAAAAPPGARDLRISGIYGSGHRGTWQFTAFITWRDDNGTIQGGGTELPQNGGQPPIDLAFSPQRLATEHALGWSQTRVERLLVGVGHLDAELAMVEFSITTGRTAVISCAAASSAPTPRA